MCLQFESVQIQVHIYDFSFEKGFAEISQTLGITSQNRFISILSYFYGATDPIRTDDLLITSELLYLLSHGSKFNSALQRMLLYYRIRNSSSPVLQFSKTFFA